MGWSVIAIALVSCNSCFSSVCVCLPACVRSSTWNTSQVTSMRKMFHGTDFNGNITLWDVSGVKEMGGMFERTLEFNQDIR